MIEKNTTHLAGEFLVAGELARRGYPVSLTMGNAKSVDIYVESQKGVLKIDAKAGRAKGNWPISKEQVEQGVFYIFVHLGTAKQIENNANPEYFIVTGREIQNRNLIDTWKTRQGIRYSALADDRYKENWAKLPPPK
jgi:hypothetical protein